MADRQRLAEQEVINNPTVQKIMDVFGAEIIEGSTKPLD
jgi:hypothetical protein